MELHLANVLLYLGGFQHFMIFVLFLKFSMTTTVNYGF